MKITILGCGFGTALSVLWDQCGHEVTAWTKYAEEIEEIRKNGEHKRLLPGVAVPERIRFTTDISCVKGADVVVFAIPSRFVREVAQKVKSAIEPETIVLNVGKGFEEGTNKRLSEVLREELSESPIVVMAGPCHAEEVGRGIPTSVVFASENEGCAEYAQEKLQTESFRIYINDDIAGCETAAALKNPIALCCGIIEGMKLGDNTTAALMTRGLAEITRLGTAMGARWETFTGLAGVGDLIVTCTSNHSRNHRAGILIGEGVPAEEAIRRVGTVEGYGCTKIAYGIAERLGVRVPIIEQLYQICYGGLPPADAARALMGRPQRHEKEQYWNT
ncbi:MAG: NAD(P)-dependent glycerol-3-phosphate dehydrogenase [Bacteroides sp.]|nr:NAD(P)-dependent glycerol-3-phosphate dehydrogenase [Eubacterium sp.]MCM1417383.1 NAD(P)-dependent glycerol-3-phosphate dehydrogenase [Roseburia sp.]MCM1461425.1 NAD(P)-dependent glycerol-3-phosphate dehydrogenase [Bacteroides sp.]